MTSVSTADVDQPAALLARAAQGDESAFEDIVRAYHTDLRRVAFIICGDLELTEDAVQQAWQIAWQRMSGVRDAARLRAWLISVVANEARKIARRQGRRIQLEATAGNVPEPADGPSHVAERVDLERALARLGADDRALLALRYVAGLDSTELGRIQGRSASGTRARLARLLARLREELDHD